MRRIIKISIGSISAAFVFLVIAALVFLLYLNPFSADSPFTGEARENCDLLDNPEQVLVISPASRVEVYKRKGNDSAPTVLLRDGDNKIKWCVYATANSLSEVHDIKFRRYGPWFLFGTRVEGIVQWTYGYEWTGWYLGPFGGLRKYYYDW
ncbi:MAG TPA: hypothetical protein VNN20_17550 [Thermodesulfobacteriota bacterium]|nr:hypothetical protein [Thermodesulfobacteriota bacterium]